MAHNMACRLSSPCIWYMIRHAIHTTTCSRSPAKPPEEAEKIFLQPDVQSHIRRLVGFDPAVVFKTKPVSHLKSPKYIFMTDEELKISLERVNKKGRKILELIPYKAPVMEEDPPQILSKDPEIQGMETANIVFTDISVGATDRTRLIVVRQPNGILRMANRDERLRMNQIYYPAPERLHYMPKMFEEEQLEKVLERKEYEFILVRACVQFDPDEADYHRVTSRVFEVINENNDFDVLRSNRLFGSLVFHLVINDKIDDLLIHYLTNLRTKEAQLLLHLYYLVHEEGRSTFESLSGDEWNQLDYFIKHHSRKKDTLERTIQALREQVEKDAERSSS